MQDMGLRRILIYVAAAAAGVCAIGILGQLGFEVLKGVSPDTAQMIRDAKVYTQLPIEVAKASGLLSLASAIAANAIAPIKIK